MRTAFVTSALVPLSVFIFACGSASMMEEIVEHEDANPTTQLVMPSDRIFAIDDFEAADLKHSKDYKNCGIAGRNRRVAVLLEGRWDAGPVRSQILQLAR